MALGRGMSLGLTTLADDPVGAMDRTIDPIFDFQIDFRSISDELHSLLAPPGLC